MKGSTIFSLFIFVMIVVGGYFIFNRPIENHDDTVPTASGAKPENKPEIVKQFSPQELASLAKLSKKKFTQNFHEIKLSSGEPIYTGVYKYPKNKADDLSLRWEGYGFYKRDNDLYSTVSFIEFNYSLSSKPESNPTLSFISFFVKPNQPTYFYWQFADKGLYEKAVSSFKGMPTKQLPDEVTEYKLDETSYVADIGFDYGSKSYVLKIYTKPISKPKPKVIKPEEDNTGWF